MASNVYAVQVGPRTLRRQDRHKPFASLHRAIFNRFLLTVDDFDNGHWRTHPKRVDHPCTVAQHQHVGLCILADLFSQGLTVVRRDVDRYTRL